MSFWGNLPSDAEESLGEPDIIHANNFSCPAGLQQARLIYTLYDLNFLEYPELTTEQNWWSCFEGVFGASISADYIISISEHSRARFLETFPHYPEERISVTYLGNRFLQTKAVQVPSEALKIFKTGEFWLGVGTIEPRKNLRRLLKAFSAYNNRSASQYPLVLAGGKGWLEDGIEEFIHELGLAEDVYMLGYVSDDELSWLYANCFCFVYPSLYEGFGLPVLEAMAQGAAVVTSNTTSLPEVAGDAGRYINPYDELDIASALHDISDNGNYREGLKKKAIIQAKQFSWEKTATEVLSIYNKVINIPKFGGYLG